jgi:hypothetical protein
MRVDLFGFERMNRRLGGFAPGIAHFTSTLVVRTFFDPRSSNGKAMQAAISDNRITPAAMKISRSRSGNSLRPISIGTDITRQCHRAANATDGQQPAGTRAGHRVI